MVSPLPRRRFDILKTPILGRFLLWKHSRTAVQLPLFVLAVMMVLDGLVGSPLAAKNTATVAAWVHYRGLIVVALLLVGNLFCAACPFVLPRRLARWLGRPWQRWPRRLRTKWLAIGALLAMLFVYELFDLWASPWLTAWVIVGYFAGAFVLEMLFTRDSFCLYVCPLGTFNFLYSTVSPLQITNRSLDACRECRGHECINGRFDAHGHLTQQGCQLDLYVPTLQSNLNCTFCLDCAKACPYDNVALAARPSGEELFRQTWRRRLDLALLAIMAACAGLVNAFAMTPPAYALEQALARWLHTDREAIVLGAIFVVGAVALPLALSFGAAWLNRWTAPDSAGATPRRLVMRYAYSFVPLGLGVWMAHYLFHLLIGPWTVVPALQNFFAQVVGWPLLGKPDWQFGLAWTPSLATVQAVQMVVLAGGLIAALAVAWSAARRAHGTSAAALAAVAPWWLILVLLAAAGVFIFLLPMEMRGNILG